MKALGVTTIYDLRSINEIEHGSRKGRGGIRQWDGCKRVHAPVFRDLDYSPEGLAEKYAGDGGKVEKERCKENENRMPKLEEALQVVFQHLGDMKGGGNEVSLPHL